MMKKYFIFLFISLFLFSCATQNKKTAFKKIDSKAELYYDYGTQYLVEKDYTKALKSLRQSYSIEPQSSKVNNNLGMAYFFKKDLKRALFHINKSIELNPQNSDARNNLASVYFYQKKYKQAYAQYEKILEDLEYNQQFRTNYNLALIDFKFNRNTIGLKRLNKAVEENPDYCPAHYQLGAYAKKVNNYSKALIHFNDAIKGVCINNPAPHFAKAQTHLKLDQQEKALFTLQGIINRFPESKYTILAKRKLRSLNISKFKAAKNHSRKSRL